MKPSPQRIAELNAGTVEAKNLMEALAIDMQVLVRATFPDIKLPTFPEKLGITKRIQQGAQAFYEQRGFKSFEELKKHPSDTLRAMACYVLSYHQMDWSKKLELIQPLACDDNSGVREWAWMALRSFCVKEPVLAIQLLTHWTKHPSDRVRRFASEITRPRGVWCPHIQELKEEPWKGLILLEVLKSDSAKYVQLSVGNWLNDAGKDHPEWVIELCKRWKKESDSIDTQKICKRALRNLHS